MGIRPEYDPVVYIKDQLVPLADEQSQDPKGWARTSVEETSTDPEVDAQPPEDA
ncbi:hypothetical protein [Streptomyces sp. NRRL S-495]|uniref:hypothetical protein n=1 Tax=Streptomyces sp. NRRL S-495 TaxID=1609133 RepID=UPI000AD5C58F|nr:hypothetical protein [Streptomyces sp. NRRL S-495]